MEKQSTNLGSLNVDESDEPCYCTVCSKDKRLEV
jgi:hypothetical protein